MGLLPSVMVCFSFIVILKVISELLSINFIFFNELNHNLFSGEKDFHHSVTSDSGHRDKWREAKAEIAGWKFRPITRGWNVSSLPFQKVWLTTLNDASILCTLKTLICGVDGAQLSAPMNYNFFYNIPDAERDT